MSDPVDVIAEAASLLLSGDLEGCRAAVERIDQAALLERRERDKAEARNARARKGAAGSAGKRSDDRPLRYWIYHRDGYVCRYCGERVIDEDVIRLFSRLAPDVIPYQQFWKGDKIHAVVRTRLASWDHVHPVVLGGTNDPGNLVCACSSCNYVKGNLTLDQLNWRVQDPVEGWDGLTRFMVPLANQVAEMLDDAKRLRSIQDRGRRADVSDLTVGTLVTVRAPSERWANRWVIVAEEGDKVSLRRTWREAGHFKVQLGATEAMREDLVHAGAIVYPFAETVAL